MGIEELQAEGGPPSDEEEEAGPVKERDDGKGFFSEAAEVKPKGKKKRVNNAIEDSDEDDDEDEEEAGGETYEQDGFVVDEGDVEEEKDDEDLGIEDDEEPEELDEDDYDLLEENQVAGVKRPRKAEDLQKKKKLRKAGTGDAKEAVDDDVIADEVAPKGDDVAAIREKLFGADDELEDEDADVPLEKGKQVEEEDFVDDDDPDEMGDFIVDENDVDENGELKANRKKRRLPKSSIVKSSLLHEAQEIFGDVNELLELHAQAELGDDEYDEYELDEEGQPLQEKAPKEKKVTLDPAEISKGFFTDYDEEIRKTDIPERIQLRHTAASAERERKTSEEELTMEAEWIFEQLLDPQSRGYSEYTIWCPPKCVNPKDFDKFCLPLDEVDLDDIDDDEDVENLSQEALLARQVKIKALMKREQVMKCLLIDVFIHEDDQDRESDELYFKRQELRKSVFTQQIREFLRLNVEEMHEVPYIGMHKK